MSAQKFLDPQNPSINRSESVDSRQVNSRQSKQKLDPDTITEAAIFLGWTLREQYPFKVANFEAAPAHKEILEWVRESRKK